MVNTMTLRKISLVAGWILIFLLHIPKNCYAFEWQDLWQTKDQQAQQQYNNGNYQQAAEQFTKPAWQAAAKYKTDKKLSEDEPMLQATTETGFYNQGNVLAKSGQLEKAIKAYEQALKLNPDNEDAEFNKALVEQALEKQQQQQQNQDDKQEQDKDQKEQDIGQSGNQQDQQNQQDQKEEPSEDPSEQQESQDSQNTDETQEQQQDSASETEQDQDKEAEQQNSEGEQKDQKDQKQEQQAEAAQSSEEDTQNSEQQQASEQWLKRIPDDPSGLLKRKFKYQYGQQKQTQQSEQAW